MSERTTTLPQFEEEMGLSLQQRRSTLLILYFSAFTIGVAFGGLMPLIALVLEGRGVSSVLIGVNASMLSIGVIVASSLIPRVIRRIGSIPAYFAGAFLTFVMLLLMPVFDSLPSWFAIRFFMGVGLAFPWIVSETLLNVVCGEKNRGKLLAIYTTCLVGGFAAGPVVLSLVGAEGALPFYLTAGLFAASCLPFALLGKQSLSVESPTHIKISTLAIAAPTIFAAAILAGVMDTTVFSMMPLYGLHLGLTEETAVVLLTIFLTGNLFLQIPVAWLADKTNRRSVLIGCAFVWTVCPLLISFLPPVVLSLAPVLFIWGGAAWSIYAVSLALLGERFRGGELAAANATFVIAFEFSNVFAPPIAGGAMEIFGPQGLMGFLAIISALFLLLTVGRSLIRR